MIGIADTGLLVAFINRGDKHHEWAVNLAGQLTGPLLTCESVLSECAFHTNAKYVFELLRLEMVTLSFDCNDHLSQLEALATRYADQRPDFAD